MTGMNNKIDRKRRKEGSLKKKFKFGRVDSEVMKRWDNNKTTLENFALMGLQYSNKFVSDNTKALNKLGMEAVPVDLTVPEAQRSKERGVNFHLQHYTKALLVKYKNDYEKMKMDHKLNFYQKTSSELEKLCRKYIVLYGHPLYGDVYQQQLKKENDEKERLETEERQEKERLENALKLKLQQEQEQKELLNKKQQPTTKAVVSKKPAATKSTKTTTTPTSVEKSPSKKVTKTVTKKVNK